MDDSDELYDWAQKSVRENMTMIRMRISNKVEQKRADEYYTSSQNVLFNSYGGYYKLTYYIIIHL